MESGEEKELRHRIARELFLLIFGREGIPAGITDLVIIPEGFFSLIPVETVTTANGQYLIEKYHIRYVQSLLVDQFLKTRVYSPGTNRKKIAVFGGGAYERSNSITPVSFRTKREWEYYRQYAGSGFFQNREMEKRLALIHNEEFADLEGALQETLAVGDFFPDGEVFAGNAASRETILELSRRGELKEFEMLHIASHGWIDREVPELSALILGGEEERGILNLWDIMNLEIRADLVTLSTCDSALGRLYSGEGIVGFTNAFMIAGANGLIVSLWKISDSVTKEFVIQFYRNLSRRNFYRPLGQIKREFIASAEFSHPFYWAPFIYYGK